MNSTRQEEIQPIGQKSRNNVHEFSIILIKTIYSQSEFN